MQSIDEKKNCSSEKPSFPGSPKKITGNFRHLKRQKKAANKRGTQRKFYSAFFVCQSVYEVFVCIYFYAVTQ